MSFEVSVNEHSEYPIITLKDTDTGSEAEIYTFGGLLNAFRIPVKGKFVNIVEGFSSASDAKKNITNGFKSAKLSPFVCRMRKGSYLLGDKTYRVNKHYLGEHAIHGLLYDSIYKVMHSESSNTKASVTLEYQYEGTDEGYPFPYHITLKWKLETCVTDNLGGNKLTVATTVSHHNPQSIPFADGWHPYFTLGDSIDNCTLQFNSVEQFEYDVDLLPTGKKITDTRFINGRSLQNINLDNSFGLEAPGKCVLSNELLRLTVEPDDNYPVLQIYTPTHRKSIAIENLSGAPDNFNNGMGLILLPPDQPKTFTTSYTVTALV